MFKGSQYYNLMWKNEVRKSLKGIAELILIMTLLSSCKNDQGKTYMEGMGMESEKYTSFVIALDHGCHTCKDRFYEYVLEAFPEQSALVFKRNPDKSPFVVLIGKKA